MAALPLPLNSAGLRLDQLAAADYPRYRALYGDPRVAGPCGLASGGEDALRTWFDAARSLPPSQGRAYALRHAGQERLAGVLRLTDWERRAGHLTLSYTLCPTLWGRGLMAGCLSPLLPWLFAGGLGEPIHRVQAWVLSGNQRSRRLLASLGFQHEGTLRGMLRLADGRHDICAYGLLAADLPNSQPLCQSGQSGPAPCWGLHSKEIPA
ncbi:GNAT family N-acetyltransferase [Chromobacterium vaccinii]|uniref:GNAT family N-acetyltransferase n=1 Tax=Chromobacterium vaccinii TaxID=1108595 RepID=UPI000E13C81E|nr:GNAT family protein [Chromobacterium vaccinii]SUX56088.1 ribosomal-protein-S5-alanine N-acetyltransferase [Chromobacterium vaccinii]